MTTTEFITLPESHRASQEQILRQLRRLKPGILARYHATGLALFGSVVRGEQTGGSDVDLLVDFDEAASLFDLTGLALFLEDELGLPVDVVPRRALRPEIRETVLNEAVPV
jgi:hypothetical protein